MKNIKLFSFILILIVLLSACGNQTGADGERNNSAEQANAAYAYVNNHLYFPDNAIKGLFSDWNAETDVCSSLFGGENSAELTTNYHSVAVCGANLYCCLNQSNAESGEYDFLVKINTESGEYEQMDYIVYGSLWQTDDTAYFCAYKKGDINKRTGIYKLNMKDGSVLPVYEDNDANIIHGTKGDITLYTFYGEYQIQYIDNNTIYFVKTDSKNSVHTLCTIQTDGRKYKEYYTASRIYNAFPLGDRVYFYGSLKASEHGDSSNYYITDSDDDIGYSDLNIEGAFRLYKGYIYGYKDGSFCRVPADNISSEPKTVFEKNGKFLGFCGEWAIIEEQDSVFDERQIFHAVKCDGSEIKNYESLVDAYKCAFNIYSDNSKSDENHDGTSNGSELSEYDSVKILFAKDRSELYEGGEIPSALGTDGGSEIYAAPDSDDTYYYFPLGVSDNIAYLYLIDAPVSFIFEGRESITLSELREKFSDELKEEFSDYAGAYTVYAEINGLSFSFGVYENEETAVFERVVIREIK